MTLHALVFNPASGGRPSEALARRVAGVFEAAGHAVRLLPTHRPGHAADLVEALLRERSEPTDVLALGGDGTLNEVLTGVFRTGLIGSSPSRVRIGALPGGTTNVVCRSLGLPRDPLAAAEAMAPGAERAVDAGLLRIHAHRRPFLLACGAGFDAEVLHAMRPSLKRWFGSAAYQLAAFTSTGERDRGLVADIELEDGRRETVACASLIAGTSTLYAGILRLSRRAAPDDGLLDIALLSSTRLLPLLRAAWHGGRTSMEDAAGVRVVQARGVRLSARREVPVHVDAEAAGCLPAEISVLPRAVRMRVGS